LDGSLRRGGNANLTGRFNVGRRSEFEYFETPQNGGRRSVHQGCGPGSVSVCANQPAVTSQGGLCQQEFIHNGGLFRRGKRRDCPRTKRACANSPGQIRHGEELSPVSGGTVPPNPRDAAAGRRIQSQPQGLASQRWGTVGSESGARGFRRGTFVKCVGAHKGIDSPEQTEKKNKKSRFDDVANSKFCGRQPKNPNGHAARRGQEPPPGVQTVCYRTGPAQWRDCQTANTKQKLASGAV